MMIISERKRFLVDYFPKRVDKNKDVNVVIFSTQKSISLEMMFQKKKLFSHRRVVTITTSWYCKMKCLTNVFILCRPKGYSFRVCTFQEKNIFQLIFGYSYSFLYMTTEVKVTTPNQTSMVCILSCHSFYIV